MKLIGLIILMTAFAHHAHSAPRAVVMGSLNKGAAKLFHSLGVAEASLEKRVEAKEGHVVCRRVGQAKTSCSFMFNAADAEIQDLNGIKSVTVYGKLAEKLWDVFDVNSGTLGRGRLVKSYGQMICFKHLNPGARVKTGCRLSEVTAAKVTLDDMRF